MNVCILSGRLATDVRYKLTLDGKAVANFLLAVPYAFKKDKDGNIPTTFIPITVWDKLAERCRDHLIKGRQVNINGYIKRDEFTNVKFKDDEGHPIVIRTCKVIANSVEFLGYRKQYSDGSPKEDNEEASTEVGTPGLSDMETPESPSELPAMDLTEIPEEEIPF